MSSLTLPLPTAHFIWYCAWLSVPSTICALTHKNHSPCHRSSHRIHNITSLLAKSSPQFMVSRPRYDSCIFRCNIPINIRISDDPYNITKPLFRSIYITYCGIGGVLCRIQLSNEPRAFMAGNIYSRKYSSHRKCCEYGVVSWKFIIKIYY